MVQHAQVCHLPMIGTDGERMFKLGLIWQLGKPEVRVTQQPMKFDICEELAANTTWNMQLRQDLATKELWEAAMPTETATIKDKKAMSKCIVERFKTLLEDKLPNGDADGISVWLGRHRGDEGNGILEALIEVPKQLSVPVRRASGKDGILFELKADDETKKLERRMRPLVQFPADVEHNVVKKFLDEEGAERLEAWGKRFLLRVDAAKEDHLRKEITGKTVGSEDQKHWVWDKLPLGLKQPQLMDFLKNRMSWEIEDIISFNKRRVVIKAPVEPPARFKVRKKVVNCHGYGSHEHRRQRT